MAKKMSRTRKRLLGVIIIAVIVAASSWGLYSALTAGARVAAALASIQAEKRIIDVHEHIQSLEQAPKLVAAMDSLGIHKTVLLGSSLYTLTLDPKMGFTHYDENDEELLQICKKYPGRFEAWPTINPLDKDKLEKFKRLMERGASGLKLYLGHGSKHGGKYMFHTVAIDDAGMLPVYKYCEDNFIPICLHVNPSPKATPGFADEFISVLEKFPDLKIVCPHYMLSSELDTRLQEFLDTFPNLYTDISFGYDEFFVQGMHRISHNPTKFRNLFKKYPNRFFFSADLVITNEPIKTQQWIHDMLNSYLAMLTQQTFTTPLTGDEQLNGLQLSPALIEGILYKNFEAFKDLKPKNTKTGKFDRRKLESTASMRRGPRSRK